MKRLTVFLIIFGFINSTYGGGNYDKYLSPKLGYIFHNGFKYKTVVSPYTKRVWLDRNLGALRVCKSENDTKCFGDYYQWDRGFDGHQRANSKVTNKQATNINSVGHSKFITAGNNYKNDWAYLVDKSGSKRAKNWNKIDGSNICPKNFRVPTKEELYREIKAIESQEFSPQKTLFNSFLKVPKSGGRIAATGYIWLKGKNGFLWTQTPNSNGKSSALIFDNKKPKIYGMVRATGAPVRCIQRFKVNSNISIKPKKIKKLLDF